MGHFRITFCLFFEASAGEIRIFPEFPCVTIENNSRKDNPPLPTSPNTQTVSYRTKEHSSEFLSLLVNLFEREALIKGANSLE